MYHRTAITRILEHLSCTRILQLCRTSCLLCFLLALFCCILTADSWLVVWPIALTFIRLKLGLFDSSSGLSTSFILNAVPFPVIFSCYADFQHALVLEPQNKTASLAEKRLRKSTSWYKLFFQHYWPSFSSWRMLMAVEIWFRLLSCTLYLGCDCEGKSKTRGKLICVGGMLHYFGMLGNYVVKNTIIQ